MANANLLDTKTVNLSEIFSNGKIYSVPEFQRDYSWEEENWEDLWNDIVFAYQPNTPHYMGAIVIQTKGDKKFTIIDGQQRFTTISILALAIIKKLQGIASNQIDEKENSQRVKLLMDQFLIQIDPASLKHSPKLFLNENNNAFFHQRLLHFSSPINYQKLNDSEKLMWTAYEYFNHKIFEYFAQENNGEKISAFLTKHIAENLKFIQITVEDELNAYTVFETLNSRGIPLTPTDLLKNYLFSLVSASKSDLGIVRQQWKKIVDYVGFEEFPTYLRYYLNSRQTIIEKENLFKKVKQIVFTPDNVFKLLDDLEKYAYIYVALGNPFDDFWRGDREITERIRELKLFRITQHKSILMVAYEKFSFEEFKKLLRDLVVISFRYNVIGKLNNKEQERVYNSCSIRIFRGELSAARNVFNELKKVYIDDETFKNSFQTKSINTNSNKKLVRYILYQIEAQTESGAKYDFESEPGTIEHILPENASGEWINKFSNEELEKYVYLIGNLTLLTANENREANGKVFSEKQKVYEKSKFAMTRSIQADDWLPATIKQRQTKLSSMACGIWKINY